MRNHYATERHRSVDSNSRRNTHYMCYNHVTTQSLKSPLIGLLEPSDEVGFVAGIVIKLTQWPVEFK